MPRLTSPSRRAANLLLESASTAAGMSLEHLHAGKMRRESGMSRR